MRSAIILAIGSGSRRSNVSDVVLISIGFLVCRSFTFTMPCAASTDITVAANVSKAHERISSAFSFVSSSFLVPRARSVSPG